MTLSEQIAQMAASLPLDRQRLVLEFVESLKAHENPASEKAPRALGLFAGVQYTMAEDFDAPLPDSFWLGEDP